MPSEEMPGIESMSKSKSSSLHVVGERPRAWLGDETVAVSDARGARVSTEANGFLVGADVSAGVVD